jgi:hypothetical protein
MAQPSHKYVLIIAGAMSFPANIVARNIVEEAISDFRSLGYEPVIIYVANRDGTIDGILGSRTACLRMSDSPDWGSTTCGMFERRIDNLRTEIEQWLVYIPEVTAIVLIAHGVTEGFLGLKCGSGFFMFKGGGLLIEWPAMTLSKKFDYVILHSCCQDNEDTRALFSYEQPLPSPPGSDYPEHCNPLLQYCFKGHTWLSSLIADLIWQWKRFPSEGPHEGTYLPIDLDKLMGLSTEQMAAIDPEEFDIPDSAEDTARQAFFYLADAHNALISGYETDAMKLAAQAYELLLDAYNEGWEMAKDVAHELGVVLGIEQLCHCPVGLRVPQDYSTIGAAIETASPGECINVGPGTYREELRIDKDKKITLCGAGAGITTIEGKITIADASPYIEGFRIIGSSDSGIVVKGHSKPILNANIIEHNRVDGITVYSPGAAEISGNIIRGNGYCGVRERAGAAITDMGNFIYYNGCDLCWWFSEVKTWHYISDSVYDTLLKYDWLYWGDGLAERWSESPTSVTFSLKMGIKFHDGAEFDAEAVVFNFTNDVDLFPGVRRESLVKLGLIQDVKVEDWYTVTFYLSPHGMSREQLLAYLASPWAAIVSPQAASQGQLLVGSGPFRLVGPPFGEEMVLERFEDYWQRWKLPELERLVFKFAREESTLFRMLLNGDVQVIIGSDIDLYKKLEDRWQEFRVCGTPTDFTHFIAMSQDVKGLQCPSPCGTLHFKEVEDRKELVIGLPWLWWW